MGRVIGQTGKIGIRTGLGEDLGVTNSDHASSLSLQRPSHDGSATALRAARNGLVDELDEVISEPYCDLLAHTMMVPKWDHPEGGFSTPRVWEVLPLPSPARNGLLVGVVGDLWVDERAR